MRLDIETTISVLLTQRYVDTPTLLQSVYFVNSIDRYIQPLNATPNY
jgi:hypothetical protein